MSRRHASGGMSDEMSDHKVSIASVIGTSTNDTTLTGARGEGDGESLRGGAADSWESCQLSKSHIHICILHIYHFRFLSVTIHLPDSATGGRWLILVSVGERARWGEQSPAGEEKDCIVRSRPSTSTGGDRDSAEECSCTGTV